MIAIQPRSSVEYPFDFLRIPFHGAAARTQWMPKTDADENWADGATIYAGETSGLVTVTDDNASGVEIGTAVGISQAGEARARVALSGNNAICTGEYRKNGFLQPCAFHIAGTVTNIWDNSGFITPAGDNSIFITDQTFDYLLEGTDTRSILILWTEIQTAGQAADRDLIQLGAVSRATPGGMVVAIRTTTRQFEHWPNSTAGSGNVANIAWNTNDTEKRFAAYLSYAEDNIFIAREGDLGANSDGNNGDTQDTIDNHGFQGTASAYAFSILSGHNGAGTSAQNFLNESSGGIRIADLLIARNPGDFLKCARGYADYQNTHYEKRIPGLA